MIDIENLKNNHEAAKKLVSEVQNNMIHGMNLDEFIFNRIICKVDPIEYIERVLRAHLPDSRRQLFENQTELIRAVCNPAVRRVAALMARQCIKKGSIIHTRDGKLLPIEDYEDSWKTRENVPLFEITTEYNTLYCTENHPIYTNNGWKRADEITPGKDKILCLYSWDKFGDDILIKEKDNLNSQIIFLKKENALVMGFLLRKYWQTGKLNTDDELVSYLNLTNDLPLVINDLSKPLLQEFIKGLFSTLFNNFSQRTREELKELILPVKTLQLADFFHEVFSKLRIFSKIEKTNEYVLHVSEESSVSILKSILFDIKANISFIPNLIQGEDNEQLFFTPCISVIKGKQYSDVYDVTFPNKGWFICSSMKVHNSGKCFKRGTKIKMLDGKSKNVEDIQPGDLLLGSDSLPREVVSTTSGSERMYTIYPTDGYEHFTVNESHILSLQDINGNILNISIKDYLKLEDKDNWFGYRTSVEYSQKEISFNPYNIGFYHNTIYYDLCTYNDKHIRRNFLAGIIDSHNIKIQNNFVYIQLNYVKDIYTTLEVARSLGFNAVVTYINHISYIRLEGDFTDIPVKKSIEILNCKTDRNPLLFKFYLLQNAEDNYYGFTLKGNYPETYLYSSNNIKVYNGQSLENLSYPQEDTKKETMKKTIRTYLKDILKEIIPNKEIHEIKEQVENVLDNNFYNQSISSEPFSTGIKNEKLFLLNDYTVVHNTESIASFTGYLLDNYPGMRIGIFTPRIQQAEVSVGRTSVFFQMNEDRLNNKIVKCTKDKIELSNHSYVSAVSGSDQSNIEGLTFDIIVLDEAQKITNYTWSERIVPMGGGCIVGTSTVQLLDGTVRSIEDIVNAKDVNEIPCIDTETNKIVTGKITEFHDTGIQETIKITLNSGKELIGTLDHPVLVYNERKINWQRLDSLKKGSTIAVPKQLGKFGNINEPLARTFGMLIGDGNYSQKCVQFASQDEELWNYLEDRYIIKKHITTTSTIGKPLYVGTILSFRQNLVQARIDGDKSIYKKLPIDFNEYDKQSAAELLGGLFDTDGCINISKDVKYPKASIEYSTISPLLINGIQQLLYKFEIRGRLLVKRKKNGMNYKGRHSDTKPLYCLYIQGKENIINFYENIKLLVNYKQDMLKKAYLNEKDNNSRFKNFINTDVRFERVLKIESAGLQHVYDLTVDKYHSFIANGIFVHNTNAKLIQIGTPKTRNHFYDAIDGKESANWTVVKRDWTRCPNLWALSSTMLPDHEDPNHEKLRPYSTFVLSLMPKSLKQEFFPTRPDAWTEGSMSVEDFRTQYMLEFVDGAGQFLRKEEVNKLKSGEFDWQDYGKIGETYVAGIDFAGSSSDSADFTHITVLRITPDNIKQKIYSEEMHGVPYPEQIQRIAQLFGGFHPRFRCKSIFADMTGCGYPVVQSLRDEFGLLELKGIIFNSSDTYTNSGMNMKNVMFATIKQEIDCDRFKYPTIDRFLESAGYNKNGFYYKQIGEWSDLECEQKISINKRIEAPTGAHDDVCCADALANFAACVGQRRVAPKPSMGHFGSSFR